MLKIGQVFRVITIFVALSALLLLTGCNTAAPKETTGSYATPTAELSPPPSPSPIQNGETEAFSYGALKLEVTNVREIKVESITDDMGKPWEYKVFVCYPGARVTVLEADMSDPNLSENGKSHAEWAILSASGERTDIVDGMKPFDVSPDVVYIYDPESSMAVLKFEMSENDE